ncbi:hypothetical protein BDV33DRAFT_198196 [Aspergillus novoparasiticus]|uniref:Uncharacterized protein n=1 Tax=Aspergillus novoparasiticus TaxID=986946 RepID=A0A5N6FAP5_9EURO|nr:hypothetical protein BDV33DRAFT_198196 [Aspergillus novoparasiticus]
MLKSPTLQEQVRSRVAYVLASVYRADSDGHARQPYKVVKILSKKSTLRLDVPAQALNYESNDVFGVLDSTLNDDDLSEPEAVAKAQDQEQNKPQTMIAGGLEANEVAGAEAHDMRFMTDGKKEMARVKIERPLMTQPALKTLINTLGNAPKMNGLGLLGRLGRQVHNRQAILWILSWKQRSQRVQDHLDD